MNRKYRSHNWDRLIPEWSDSGLSVYAFCKNRDIPQSAMYSALRKRNSTPVFVPVSISPEPEHDPISKGSITVCVGSATIKVEHGFDPELFKTLYLALVDIC